MHKILYSNKRTPKLLIFYFKEPNTPKFNLNNLVMKTSVNDPRMNVDCEM